MVSGRRYMRRDGRRGFPSRTARMERSVTTPSLSVIDRGTFFRPLTRGEGFGWPAHKKIGGAGRPAASAPPEHRQGGAPPQPKQRDNAIAQGIQGRAAGLPAEQPVRQHRQEAALL